MHHMAHLLQDHLTHPCTKSTIWTRSSQRAQIHVGNQNDGLSFFYVG